MGKLSTGDAKIIARQICATWNQQARAENEKIKEKELRQALDNEDWQSILKILGVESIPHEDLDYHLREVFEDFVLNKQRFPRVQYMKFDDALRIVEFCGLQGHHLPEIESVVLKAWQSEQR